jgi:hypothetical protein
MTRLPPYGKQIIAAKNAGRMIKDIRIMAGADCWLRAKSNQWLLRDGIGTLCFPTGENPGSYDWSVVRDSEVTILFLNDGITELETLHELGILLVQLGANLVVICQPGFVPMPLYKPMMAAAA